MIKGIVKRISGPIIRVEGLGSAGLFDVVEVGEKKLIGEIVRLESAEAVVQVYEDDTGLMIGAEATSTGRPLSVLLGPGLIGTIYDGIQRPLKELFSQSGAFMESGKRGDPLDVNKKWPFVPDPNLVSRLSAGEKVSAVAGLVLGTVKETESITCKIMVAPNPVTSHALAEDFISTLSPAGEYTISSVIARTERGREIPLTQWWPVR
ncbi:MAG: V-type ATP synthase subunit A, partial [Treponema sp.]|nr:V-type ATP synthase subunit A [Treponema sp.]